MNHYQANIKLIMNKCNNCKTTGNWRGGILSHCTLYLLWSTRFKMFWKPVLCTLQIVT